MSTTDHTGSGAVLGQAVDAVYFAMRVQMGHRCPDQTTALIYAREFARAALASQPAPVRASIEGDYVLVPREPAPGMERAFDVAYWNKANDIASPTPTEHPDDGGGAFGYGYRAMLAATPRSDRPLTGTPDASADLGELARLSKGRIAEAINKARYTLYGLPYRTLEDSGRSDREYCNRIAQGVIEALSASSSPAAVGGAETPPEAEAPAHGNRRRWCQPMDVQDRQVWLLKFEDQDQGSNIYHDEVKAREAFRRANDGGWNCWLFAAAPAVIASPSPSSAAGGSPFYQFREIGEGQDWQFCSKAFYDDAQTKPELDTREVPALSPRPAGPGAQAQSPDLGVDGWIEELDLSDEARNLINRNSELLSLLYDLDLLPEQLLSQDEKTPGLVKAYHRLYGVLYAYRALHPLNPAEAPTPESEVRTPPGSSVGREE